MSNRWLSGDPKSLNVVIDVGCIECGEGSQVVGIYRNPRVAEIMAQIVVDAQRRNWTGQHAVWIASLDVQ